MKYELNHDAIAKQVFEKATVDMKARRKVEQLVKNNYELYLKRQALMSQEQLEEIRPFRQALNLSQAEKDFVEKSEKALAAAQKRKFIITLSIIATLAIMGAFAAWQWYKSVQQQRIAESGRLVLLAQQQLSNYNFNDAFHLAQEALVRDPKNNTAKDIQSKIFHRSFDNGLTPLSTASFQEKSGVINATLNTEGSLLALTESDSSVHVFDISQEATLKTTITDCDTTFKPVFSPDNKVILTLKNDSILQINRLDTLGVVLLRGHTAYIRGAQFLNIDTLFTWGNDGDIKMWDIKGQLLQDIGHQADFVISVEISSDSIHLLSTDEGGKATIWSLKENEDKFEIMHLSNLQAARFWNKDSILLFGSEGIETWSRKQKKPIVMPLPLADSKYMKDVSFSPDGDNLLFINNLGNAYRYTCVSRIHQYFDFFGGNSRQKAKYMKVLRQMDNMSNFEPADFLHSMTFSPTANVEKAGFFNGSYIWTIGEGSNDVYLRQMNGSPLAVMAHPTPPLGVEITARNLVAVTYSYDGYVKIWKNNAIHLTSLVGITQDRENGASAVVYFTPDNRRIVTTGFQSPMKWYSADGQLQKVFYDFNADGVAFSPTEQWIVAYRDSSDAAIFDSLGQIVKKIAFETPKAVHFSPDGAHFLMYSSKTVGIWNNNGDLQSDTIFHLDEIFDALFTPDSKHILTLSRDSLLSEWTLEGKLVRNIASNERNLSIEFSPDGKTLLTSGSDGFIRMRDYKTGNLIRQLGGEKNYIQSANFFPDGKKILALDADNHSMILSTEGKQLYQKLFGGKLSVTEYLNKGAYLLLTSSEAIELWSADNRRIITYQQILEREEKPNFSLAISKDSKRILIAFDDGTAKEYLTPEGIADWLKGHPTMQFMPIEKTRYAIQ
jgi:WD40 repeat protein